MHSCTIFNRLLTYFVVMILLCFPRIRSLLYFIISHIPSKVTLLMGIWTPSNTDTVLWAYASMFPQTASRSVQPFLHSSPMRPTHRHTCTQTTSTCDICSLIIWSVIGPVNIRKASAGLVAGWVSYRWSDGGTQRAVD